ncbi:MAG: bifunctional indole-3-glycerol phosphate synthase/phosphoribosylanthranilate isomerase [Spirochaeta sp.]|nr:bifunctional indole-3-glycerol phosphate synthase/phosphoribosylanthranilate isomerase [Spirochaeta sp.]
MNTPDILLSIRGRREARLAVEGPTLGVAVPVERLVPLVPFGGNQFVIAEIKRKSPSAGEISAAADPVQQAGLYVAEGLSHFSVLTEEDFFSGSLVDLMQVKQAFPSCAVLRKDFLLNAADVDVSYNAGADAVLLIAAMLSPAEAREIMQRARERGLAVLVECHDAEEIEAVRELEPDLYGINSRDLRTFRMDPLLPPALRGLLPPDARCVYESGIFGFEDALLAGSSDFHGVLVGEALMRNPAAAGEISRGLAAGHALLQRSEPGRQPERVCGNARFWSRLAARRQGQVEECTRRPLVKICGITQAKDAELAVELGADVLGFVFADSPRRATSELLHKLAGTDVLKVAVVVNELSPEVQELLKAGLLDAVQLHGDERPEDCLPLCYPYYKALRLSGAASRDSSGGANGDTRGGAASGQAGGGPADAGRSGEQQPDRVRDYRCPRVLLDAFVPGQAGGTGKRIDRHLVEQAATLGPLWLAGGLNPENIAEIIRDHSPELIDASSGLESVPGRKDPERMQRYFQEIQNATTSILRL